ncbi:MAG: mannonate dehydratase [Actinomycetota bacterium]
MYIQHQVSLSAIDDEMLSFLRAISVDMIHVDLRRGGGAVGDVTSLRDGVDHTEAFEKAREQVEGHGMTLNNLFMSSWDAITLGREDTDDKIDAWGRMLESMGRAGIKNLGWNFKPRGNFRTTSDIGRGGVAYSTFDREEFDGSDVARHDPPVSEDAMWERMEAFLRGVLPVAKKAGVRMALHPDDPPIPEPLGGVAQICSTLEQFRRIFDMGRPQDHGMVFCQGCMTELVGDGVYDVIEEFSGAGRTAWLAVLPAAAALALLGAPTPTMTAVARTVRTLARLLPSGAVDRLAIPADGGGTGTGRRTGRLVRGVALRYLGVLGVRSLGFVVLGTAVVGHVDAHVVTALLGGFAVSNLVGRVVVIAPAGLGVREAMLLAVLAPTLGIGPAGVIAVVARLLDAVAEAVFVGLALLWRDPRAGGALEGDAVLVLPDATAVLVGMVHERTWSRVAEGKQGAQRVWCKQHLDRRRRPDPAGARAQAAAARRAAGVGLPAVPPLALLEECAVTVHPWVDVEPPGSGLPTLVGRLALGQVDGTGSAPLFGVDAVMAGVAGPVLLDLPDLSGSPEQQAGELVASALRIRWGRPLRGFVAGPDWPLAVAVLAELAVRPSTDVVRHRQLEWWSDRRGEWVGRTGRDAATRWLGVHTLGVAYHRRILHGLAAGRLSPTPDGPVPASGTVEVIR